MTTPAEFELSASLYPVVTKAVDYAIKALNASDTLPPFAITWSGEETTIERYMHGAYDDSIEFAMRAVNDSEESVTAYAVVWNGYVDVGGNKRHAVIFEVGDRQSPQSMQLAQPYVVPVDSAVQADGEVLALGSAQNLLLSKINNLSLSQHLIKPAYATTETMAVDVTSQPYAQLPVALICLAANLFEGEEQARITLGIRKLQSLEADTSVALSHRVFSVVTAAIADGDLMHVLPADNIDDMVQIVLNGAAQIHQAVKKGLVWDEHAKAYFEAVKSILTAVLTKDGAEPISEAGAKLVGMLDKAAAA